MSRLRVQFERSGGFAGIPLRVTVDSQTLAPEQARRLRELVAAARFFDRPAPLAPAAAGADRFLYKVTVEDGGRRRALTLPESAVPPDLEPLLAWLTAAARRG